MRNRLLLAASAMAISFVTTMASAQEARQALAFGRSEQVQLPAGGREYTLNLERGQRLEVILRSEDFDAYLRLTHSEGDGEDLATDDDGLGKGTDSRLRYTAREPGLYVIHASSLSGEEAGAAILEANLISPPAPARAKRIRVGTTESGTISTSSAEDDSGHYFDLYRVRLTRGERIAVRLNSDDFDAFLEVGQTEDGVFNSIVTNDDGSDGTHSYLVFTAPDAGEYDIRARGLSEGSVGRYRLAVEAGPERQTATPLALGVETQGKLDETSGVNNSGQAARLYSFEGREGQRYEITLTSDDFDTYLELFDDAEVSLATDDDSGGNLNSQLLFTPDRNGTYYIEARGLGDGTGDFEIKLDTLAPPPPLQTLRFNSVIEAELTDNDGTLGGTARYDGYKLTLEEGQRVQIVMRSAEFDTMLELSNENEPFEAIVTDDDGLGDGTNSRLLFQAPTAGTYVVRALSFNNEARGAYDIEVSDRGPEPQAGSILIGHTVRATLSERDNTRSDGSYYDDYVFTAKAEEKLRFSLIASAFDAVVIVGEMRNDEFRELSQDDDGLSDTHARLNWTAPREGTYVVRATSYGSNETGDYVLTVERQP